MLEDSSVFLNVIYKLPPQGVPGVGLHCQAQQLPPQGVSVARLHCHPQQLPPQGVPGVGLHMPDPTGNYMFTMNSKSHKKK